MTAGGTTFANYRGVVPMLWVFCALAATELVVVHIFVALKWPMIAWPLTAISAASIMWVVAWIISWKRLPHRLDGGILTLHMGRLRKVEIPVVDIRTVTPVDSARLKAPDTRNLVPLAYPNRLIELGRPLGPRRWKRIAVRVDDPEAFDAAIFRACPRVEGG